VTKLQTSSYVVLALVERLQPATAYELKRLAHSTVFNFWALPHTVIYTETQRLEVSGLLHSDQEQGGRRRRRFTLTKVGRGALAEWLSTVTDDEFLELRDPGLLKLFAGADAHAIGEQQLRRHRQQLREYEQLDQGIDVDTADDHAIALKSTLAAGIRIERVYVEFWAAIAEQGRATDAPLTDDADDA
jgi:DNA-binding PadR family transcriptional regulator